MFVLTDFEDDLICHLRQNLPSDWVPILEDQLKRFNKIDRVLKPGSELPFGHTSFYWVKFGKAKLDFPVVFPSNKEEYLLATLEIIEEENVINVSFRLVKGFLFSIEYRSKKKVFNPQGEYRLCNFKLVLPELTAIHRNSDT